MSNREYEINRRLCEHFNEAGQYFDGYNIVFITLKEFIHLVITLLFISIIIIILPLIKLLKKKPIELLKEK